MVFSFSSRFVGILHQIEARGVKPHGLIPFPLQIRRRLVSDFRPIGIARFDVAGNILVPFALNVPVQVQIERALDDLPDCGVGHKLLSDRHAIGTPPTIGGLPSIPSM